MIQRVSAGVAVLLLLGGCFVPDPGLTDSGKGRPRLTLDFPENAAPGSVATAEIVVSNPGPEDMGSVVVAFSRLGDPELPPPLVEVASRDGSNAVRAVEPEPVAVSSDQIVYRFAGLDEGAEMTITFEIEVPTQPGSAGNAVLVYDGGDPERARGVRLETEVGG